MGYSSAGSNSALEPLRRNQTVRVLSVIDERASTKEILSVNETCSAAWDVVVPNISGSHLETTQRSQSCIPLSYFISSTILQEP